MEHPAHSYGRRTVEKVPFRTNSCLAIKQVVVNCSFCSLWSEQEQLGPNGKKKEKEI